MKPRKLFEQLQIGNMRLRNRIVMPSMNTNLADEDGYVTESLKGYYKERAKGGVGLIIVEGTCIDFPTGKYAAGMLALDNDKFMPGMREFVDGIHEFGAKASVQIHHGGPRAVSHLTGIQPVGPSPVSTLGRGAPLPRELTVEEIADLVIKYGQAVQRAVEVGFDAVEIQFGGGYLLGSFLSAVTNRRTDAYGGSLENRSRIHREIIQEVRARVETEFPVCCRFNVRELGGELGVEGCRTVEDGQTLAKMFADQGISAISVLEYGFFQSKDGTLLQDHFRLFPDERGTYANLSQAIKQVVDVPVITAGRINVELAETILENGQADLVAVGRQTIADPYWPQKAAQGKLAEIAPCIVCRNCIDKIISDRPLNCSVNASAGREGEYELRPAQTPKKVMIIGAGPSGLEAARVAALRGHEVSVFDQDRAFGGLLPVAAVIKGLEPENFYALANYFKGQMQKLGVRVVLGKRVEKSFVRKFGPDVLILAGGGVPGRPDITGLSGKNVASPEKMKATLKTLLGYVSPGLLRSLTKIWMPVGKRVVILGGSIIGLELAEFFVKRGRSVTVLEQSHELGTGMAMLTSWRLTRWLRQKGATLITGVVSAEIHGKKISYLTDKKQKETLEADTVIPALNLRSNDELVTSFSDGAKEVHVLGDCLGPRFVRKAIHDGAATGRLV